MGTALNGRRRAQAPRPRLPLRSGKLALKCMKRPVPLGKRSQLRRRHRLYDVMRSSLFLSLGSLLELSALSHRRKGKRGGCGEEGEHALGREHWCGGSLGLENPASLLLLLGQLSPGALFPFFTRPGVLESFLRVHEQGGSSSFSEESSFISYARHPPNRSSVLEFPSQRVNDLK